jgi:hypothetical protein
MKRQAVLYPLIVSFALVGVCFGADQSFADQFLGSPLLILAVAIAVDAVAFLYRRIRK